jgi:hypothetical protein
MKALLLLSVLISLSSPALARIGETPEQCEARYGKHIPHESADSTSTMHRKAGYEILCAYHEGKCEKVSFVHEEDASGQRKPIPDAEIMALMHGSSGGKPWTKIYENTEKGRIRWQFENLEALYGGPATPMLIISTKAYQERTAAEKAKDKEKLKDF